MTRFLLIIFFVALVTNQCDARRHVSKHVVSHKIDWYQEFLKNGSKEYDPGLGDG